MIAEKMKGMVANSSAIRAMFEEGNRLAGIYGAWVIRMWLRHRQ